VAPAITGTQPTLRLLDPRGPAGASTHTRSRSCSGCARHTPTGG